MLNYILLGLIIGLSSLSLVLIIIASYNQYKTHKYFVVSTFPYEGDTISEFDTLNEANEFYDSFTGKGRPDNPYMIIKGEVVRQE